MAQNMTGDISIVSLRNAGGPHGGLTTNANGIQESVTTETCAFTRPGNSYYHQRKL